jgi:hypothetical protein
MGTMKADLCKQIWEKTYIGQLEWARSQTTKMTQIRDIKSSLIKQQEDWEEMRAYISNKVKMHTYHLNFETLNNVFYKDS